MADVPPQTPDGPPDEPAATPSRPATGPPQEAAPRSEAPKTGLLDLLSPGEQLIGIGGAVVVAVDLVGDVVFDDYSVGPLLWFFGVIAVIAVIAHGVRGTDIFLPYRWVLLTAGYGAGLAGFRGMLYDLDNSVFSLGGATVFFAVLTLAAAVVMTVGAVRLSRDDSV